MHGCFLYVAQINGPGPGTFVDESRAGKGGREKGRGGGRGRKSAAIGRNGTESALRLGVV